MTRGSVWGCYNLSRSALLKMMDPSSDVVFLSFLASNWTERTSCICLIIRISPRILFFRYEWFRPPIIWIVPREKSSSFYVVLSALSSPRLNLGLGLTSAFSALDFSLLTYSFRFPSQTSWSKKTFRPRQFPFMYPLSSWKKHLHLWLRLLGSPPMGSGFWK